MRRRPGSAALVALALGLGVPALAASGSLAAAAPPARFYLFKDSRQTLAIARAQGRKQVSLLLVARAGAAGTVARETARLGGDVRYLNDEIGYLRVRVPIDRATDLAEYDGIESAALDYDDDLPSRLLPRGGPSPGARPATGTPSPLLSPSPSAEPERPDWPPRLTEYPLEHPYSPLKDLAADEFLAKHPTFDGRGVTIALLDGNLDMLLPEFQTAYSLDGKPIPKIADYRNVTDPRDDADLNPQWVDMKATVTSRGGKVSFGGKTFTVPRDGAYRIGLFSERRFNQESNAAYINQDIDRDGNPKGDDGLFGVLWDEKTNDVWVDTNRDGSFADEKRMTDYIKRGDLGVFGKDDPKTPVRESVGFAVQTDSKNKFVSINVGIYQHATIIMGSVVGNREPKGRIRGVAPGARLVSMFYGVSNAHGMIEGLIAAFKHPLVDLIVLEQSSAIASDTYLLADAAHPISLVAERLTRRYGKLLFVPGGNSPAFGLVAEDGLAPSAVSVGGYQSKESYRLNWGFVPEQEDNLHWGALSHGPSGSGQIKPDLLAASGQMSTDPGYRLGQLNKGFFRLPPGYSVDGGTSTATPMAAGATALVVSAAKQSGVKYDSRTLKAAMTGSARPIAHLRADEQGNGLIQVGPAFELLKKLSKAPAITIASRAPVRTKLSHLLRTPNEGVGLYEREGWKAGDRGERSITLTRTSGPAGPMTFALRWEENDGTFESPASVELPLKTPVAVAVKILAKGEGAHTAILTVDHASVPGHVHRVMTAVIVPYRLTPENGYSVKAEVTPPLPGDLGVFVEVPPGTAALTFSASSPNALLSAVGPDRDAFYPCAFDLEPKAPPNCSLSHPQAGVWEINVDTGRVARKFDPEALSPLKASPVTVTATALAVDVAATTSSLGAPASDRSVPVALGLTNRLGKVAAAATSVDLASVRRKHASISQGEQHVYEVSVPKGTTSLSARVWKVADPRADLDIYVLDCTNPEKPAEEEKTGEQEKGNKSPMRPPPLCAPAAKAIEAGPEGSVDVASPKAGRWFVVVDAFSIPHGTTDYEYMDLFTHPSLGGIAVADLPEERGPSSHWAAKANAWAASSPEPPRRLGARLIATSKDVTGQARSGAGETHPIALGSADLWFEDSSPAAGSR